MDSYLSARMNRNAEARGVSDLDKLVVVKDAKYWELKYIKLFNKRKVLLAALKQKKLEQNKLISKETNERPAIELINVNTTKPHDNTELENPNELSNACGKSLKEESSSRQVFRNTRIVCSKCYTKSGFRKVITRTHSHVTVN